jgi:hypothetical protein
MCDQLWRSWSKASRKERLLPEAWCALNLEHATLGRDTTRRGEPVQSTIGREYAVTGHNDRKWIPAEYGADRPGGTGRSDGLGDLAIASCCSWPDLARSNVDTSPERIYSAFV